MPLPPTDPARVARTPVSLPSPREAALKAAVYRRRRQQKPHERWLRILGMAGALLVHLMFLFGVILGPAYELEELPESSGPALQVRLIEKKQEEPPPPPPVRGTPPKEVGPVHRGSSAPTVVRTTRSSTSSTRTDAELAPVPVPALETPVVVVKAHPSAPAPEAVAAPQPKVALPKPAPAPELQPVPTATEPPQVTLQTPPAPVPVPPKFQPEPVRKLQVEGNQPVPPPASLAMPEVPLQSAPTVTAPTIAMERAVPKPATPSLPQLTHADVAAAPSEPEMQAVPLPAQAAPTVNLQITASTTTPVVPREQPRIQAPSIRVAEAQLEAVPLPENAQPSLEKPQAPRLETVAPKAIALDRKPTLERPQIQVEPASAEATKSASAEAAQTAAESKAASAAAGPKSSAPSSETAQSSTDTGKSTAPNATPQGSETGTPGVPNGVASSPSNSGKSGGLNLALPPGQGNGQSSGQGGGAQGGESGPTGTYVQLQPRGNTEIMSHGRPNIGYKATRFEQDWTPEGESSIDTALRRAVEKTTVRHTFHLPRGVRVECVVMPLFPMGLLGCGNGDPPPKPVDDKVYERMKLAPANPLVPPPPASSTAPVASAIKLDNSAQCATARVSGGPLPPGCVDDRLPAGRDQPAKATSAPTSWVPASDQFH
ncbi:hypothetical protein [Dyella subtropica]|uniref:hypothetical protein n=1 Tax=Dyella subtropica TaxID=2992127 RepID=UPI00225B2065|nr:hypothetical protein [Dyella subtropica]